MSQLEIRTITRSEAIISGVALVLEEARAITEPQIQAHVELGYACKVDPMSGHRLEWQREREIDGLPHWEYGQHLERCEEDVSIGDPEDFEGNALATLKVAEIFARQVRNMLSEITPKLDSESSRLSRMAEYIGIIQEDIAALFSDLTGDVGEEG